MHDAQLEQDLSALLAGRTDPTPGTPLRRYAVTPDSLGYKPPTENLAALAASPAEAGAEASRAPVVSTDFVNHPPHYTAHPSGIECIEITRWMNFNLGNAMKYIWRAGDKDNEIEDLRKAAWYIADEIARLEKLRDGQ